MVMHVTQEIIQKVVFLGLKIFISQMVLQDLVVDHVILICVRNALFTTKIINKISKLF